MRTLQPRMTGFSLPFDTLRGMRSLYFPAGPDEGRYKGSLVLDRDRRLWLRNRFYANKYF